MKRLLGDGWERIYQICRCFRNGERSDRHNPEFTMVEWYRAYASYEEIMEDVQALVGHVCQAVLGDRELVYNRLQIDLRPPWERLTVREAFARYAGLEDIQWRDKQDFEHRVRELGCDSVAEDDSWEDIFYKLLLEKVEPALAERGPVFLVDYPANMAALAKLKEGDDSVAERVELYIGGLELANGFTELNDPAEQHQRFIDERQRRLEAGYPAHPLDEEFLEMLERGMPPAGGMALGIDRLVMLLADAQELDHVVAFPFPKV